MNLVNFIQIHHLHAAIYFVVFFGMFFDAIITVFVTVFLISTGVVTAIWGVSVLIAGIFGEQCFYFWLGHKLSSHQKISKWADKLAAPFDKQLLSKTFRTLLVSKFIYGLHRAMLVRSGMIKLPVKKFVEYAVYIAAIWLAVVGGLAVIFAASYTQFKQFFRYAEIIPLIVVLALFLAERFFSGRLKKDL